MSRNQKPGKIKVVAARTPNPGRRRGDNAAHPGEAGVELVPAQAVAVSRFGASFLLLALVFLLACAAGGAAATYFGLVGDMVK